MFECAKRFEDLKRYVHTMKSMTRLNWKVSTEETIWKERPIGKHKLTANRKAVYNNTSQKSLIKTKEWCILLFYWLFLQLINYLCFFHFTVIAVLKVEGHFFCSWWRKTQNYRNAKCIEIIFLVLKYLFPLMDSHRFHLIFFVHT